MKNWRVSSPHFRLIHLVSVSFKPEKFIYTQENEKCRMKPYNELIYEKIHDDLQANCQHSCRQPDYFLCDYYMNAVKALPICKTQSEDPCYYNVKRNATRYMAEQGLQKPCTKIVYRRRATVWPDDEHFSRTMLALSFEKPARLIVKEEYLIYDLVSTIGAIGGTLGLCIGFSLTELVKIIQQAIRVILNRLKNVKTGDSGTFFLKTQYSQRRADTAAMPESIARALARLESQQAEQVQLNAKLERDIAKCHEKLRAFQKV